MQSYIGKLILGFLPVLFLMGCEEKTYENKTNVYEENSGEYGAGKHKESTAETSPAPKPGSTLEKRIAEYSNVKGTISDNAPNSKINKSLHNDTPGTNTNTNNTSMGGESDFALDSSNVNKEQTVPLAKAHYEKISFFQNSSELTKDAERGIKELSANLKQGVPSYVTIRARDKDNIEPTDPSGRFAQLTKPRAEAIRKELLQNNIQVAKMVIDEAGYVENQGEGTVMAKPDNMNAKQELQYIIIAFEENDQKQKQKIKSNL